MQQYQSMIFFVAIIAVFYFLIIRPQKKRQKDQLELMDSLQPDAEIMTIGGIYGTIVSVNDDRVRISVADGTEFEVSRRAIARVLDESESDSVATEDEGDAIDDAPVTEVADVEDTDSISPAVDTAESERSNG